MRFLLFAAQYLPTAGGVERYTHSLAKTLAGMGHSVTVVTCALPGLPAGETDANGIRVERLPARRLLNGRFPALRKNAAFKAQAEAIWRQGWDFALINTRFYPLSLWAAKGCRERSIPAIVVEHGTKHLSLDSVLLNRLVEGWEHAMMRAVRRHCDDFYGVSQACNRWLEHFGVAARGTLYNAVDAEELLRIAGAAPLGVREKLGIDENAPLIAFVGRLIVEKGVHELLEAMALLRRRLPDATLVMAGGGPLLEALRAQNAPGVHVVGEWPYPDTIALLAQCDVFCLPTYSEGFSGTILEAAAVGACIVTTPTGGSPELISDGESGILLKDRAPATIADALLHALQSSAFRSGAGYAVQQAVMARFTWPATAETLVSIATHSI